MEKGITVLQVIMPIFAAIALGMLAHSVAVALEALGKT